ncbi:unnamed protein product [Discula destructiva]
MATTTPPPPPPPPQATQQQPSQDHPPATAHARTPDWMHYGAWGVAILGPIALFTPPRRVGLQAILLATGTSYATNILAYDYTGESIYQRTIRRWNALAGPDDGNGSALPEKARRTQEIMRRERERREALLPEAERARLREEREAKERASRGVLERLWMGTEKEGWKEERARKEREALQEGKGYGDLIVEQVKEVFSSPSKPGEEGEKKEGGKKDGEEGGENKKP